MPTSHAASRMVLLVLVIVAAAVLLVIGVDRAWSPISGQVQKAWSALRAALPGDTEPTALSADVEAPQEASAEVLTMIGTADAATEAIEPNGIAAMAKVVTNRP